ncbi:HicA-like toxin of HicAB toxin-antitoxin system [Yoonia maricola]|uniref:HicA-like toxin of HicAB toxin-antitoxin system n=1 Tax=Yoonia maricola TaxID=420999 RepID=A0A2M8WJX0_9RHOB|nr:type II toxin-antitoxin system HicA family toxin [Yoonia maricola]PJI91196.1 HicA-like toxin of HicAB toxin-antitoxin system [Yoonia maricola]
MSRREKLLARLRTYPKDFEWSELETLLKSFGYVVVKKSGGSRRKFVGEDLPLISLHEPHPDKVVKSVYLKQVVEVLLESGIIK